MKTRTAYQKEELFYTYEVGIWMAAGWQIAGRLQDVLIDKAFAACGHTKSDLFGWEANVQGNPKWIFQVKLFKKNWVAVEEDI